MTRSIVYMLLNQGNSESNSLKKTKNWSGRNEVIETSGRLHALWPQDKGLHMPRTTDYRHTRQDSWIQTKLVSTLAKNATKPNTFEIILLQTARKENNWKTEETLERAVVTLYTERIKGFNPWCVWWWWQWWLNQGSCTWSIVANIVIASHIVTVIRIIPTIKANKMHHISASRQST